MPRNKICDIRKSMRKIEERETGISKFCRFVEEEKCLVSSRDSYIQLYVSSGGEDTVNPFDSGMQYYFRVSLIGRQRTFTKRFIAFLV